MKNAVSMIQANFVLPHRQLLLMLVIISLVAFGSYSFTGLIERIFLATPYLNGLIVAVFLIGILACFWQIIQIYQSITWLDRYALAAATREYTEAPRLIAPFSSLLEQSGPQVQISSASARSILDSVSSRMDESRDISRYLSNLLIFLGLLGTFFGLATTVPAVLDTIKSISPGKNTSAIDMFQQMMDGIETQLSGMGVAFSSSLLGLAGSLVIGLLDLFAGHGQNRFYRELEEWISTITRIGTTRFDSEIGTNIEQDSDVIILDNMMREFHEMVVELKNNRNDVQFSINELNGAAKRMSMALEEQQKASKANIMVVDEVITGFQGLLDEQAKITEHLYKISITIDSKQTQLILQSIEQQLVFMARDNAIIRDEFIRLGTSDDGDENQNQ